MKKIAILIALVTTFVLNESFAKANKLKVDTPQSTEAQIIEKLDCPNFISEIGNSGTILLDLSVNADGSIHVNEKNYSNFRLMEYVEQKLSQIKIQTKEITENRVLLKLVFSK